MFIVFEGIDGSGKDTQLKKVFNFLLKENKYNNILKTQEPSGGGEYGTIIRDKLRTTGFKSPKEGLDLFILDRLSSNVYKKHFLGLDNSYILCSRGDLSTYAYQSIDTKTHKGFSFEDILDYHYELDKEFPLEHNVDLSESYLVEPDITFFIDITAKEAIKRIKNRNILEGLDVNDMDFFENEDFLAKTRTKYLEAISFLKEKSGRNIHIIDGTKSPEEIFEEIKILINGI